jgi:hypothetical protein
LPIITAAVNLHTSTHTRQTPGSQQQFCRNTSHNSSRPLPPALRANPKSWLSVPNGCVAFPCPIASASADGDNVSVLWYACFRFTDTGTKSTSPLPSCLSRISTTASQSSNDSPPPSTPAQMQTTAQQSSKIQSASCASVWYPRKHLHRLAKSGFHDRRTGGMHAGGRYVCAEPQVECPVHHA